MSNAYRLAGLRRPEHHHEVVGKPPRPPPYRPARSRPRQPTPVANGRKTDDRQGSPPAAADNVDVDGRYGIEAEFTMRSRPDSSLSTAETIAPVSRHQPAPQCPRRGRRRARVAERQPTIGPLPQTAHDGPAVRTSVNNCCHDRHPLFDEPRVEPTPRMTPMSLADWTPARSRPTGSRMASCAPQMSAYGSDPNPGPAPTICAIAPSTCTPKCRDARATVGRRAVRRAPPRPARQPLRRGLARAWIVRSSPYSMSASSSTTNVATPARGVMAVGPTS